MNSPYFSSEHETFRTTLRRFVEKEVVPFAEDWERERRIPRSIWKRMGELGFLGINYPEEYGGTEADIFYSVIFLEELARCTMGGFAAAVGVHSYMASEYIHRYGAEEMKKRYLVQAITGEKIGALAVTEPDAGSDVASIRTRAVRDGDYYAVSGSKTFITNGVYGDFILVAAKTDPDAGVGGISLILVERDTPGLTARQLKKIGWHCSDTAELTFEDVRVPLANCLGKENEGFYYIMECFQLERLVSAIIAVSGAEHGLEATLHYISERQAFNRPLARFQAIRHSLVDLRAELEAARQLTHYTAWLHQQGEQAVMQCSMAKLVATEMAKKMADTCIQYHGGYGYTDEYLISRMYRDARVGTIVGGTSEIMREIIARMMIDGVQYETHRDETGIGPGRAERKPGTDKKQTVITGPIPETASEIIGTLPERFRREKAGDWETTFHFDIKGSEGGQYTITILNGTCRVETGLHGEPRCIVRTSDTVYRDIELGILNPEAAFMLRKIKISNMGEMVKFTKMFRRLYKK